MVPRLPLLPPYHMELDLQFIVVLNCAIQPIQENECFCVYGRNTFYHREAVTFNVATQQAASLLVPGLFRILANTY